LRKRSESTAAVLKLARNHDRNGSIRVCRSQLVPYMTSILRVRDHLTRDQPANLAWIIDQVKLSLTDGDVMQRILLNDGNDAQEWMEVTQVVR
jgi:hypothetical protein